MLGYSLSVVSYWCELSFGAESGHPGGCKVAGFIAMYRFGLEPEGTNTPVTTQDT